jgi:hypothetical protein
MSEGQKTVVPVDVLSPEHRRRGRVPVDTRLYAPNFMPSGLVLFVGGALVIMGGLAVVIRSNRRRTQREVELRSMRQDLAPLLQYEADRQLHEYMWIRKLYEDSYLDELVRADPSVKEEVGIPTAPLWSPFADPIYNTRFVPPVEVSRLA